MARSRYIVGIDLGTTNCAVAFVDTKGRARPTADLRPFPVPQLVAPGEVASRPMLPSFLYLPAGPELPPGAARLPWDPDADRIVGEFARSQGARVPARLVASAKSWLCHAGVDREANILPWGAAEDVPKVSPVAASAALLTHIRDAWNHEVARGDASARLEAQEIVLTVPASFDEAARELTVSAAKQAGFSNLTLLEEPQAAFYCWIVTHQERWQSQVKAGELILVCDIGGGTTDFSLITVVESPTGPGFRRVAVGDHLLLGGDNIDLALAHLVEAKLGGARLDPEQWSALRYSCRSAKERLLAEGGADRVPVTIPGRGARVIGGSLRSELSREEVHRVAIEGFFPVVPREAEPEKAGKIGFQEFGLPFVSDPAIPKHLAAFLRRHRAEAILPEGHPIDADGRPARPDAILFNGGALTPEVVRRRLVEVVTSWFPDEPDGSYAPRVLANESLDLAVAHGAAYYGVVRRGGGIRIGGGTARSFYIGLQTGDGANGTPWLCTVPRDAQEGDEFHIADRSFELLVDRPVLFPLASSSVRPQDRPGDLVPENPDSILGLPPLASVMRVGRKAKAERVPVELAARVTEVGTLELWCQSRSDDRRWRLQIQFRNPDGSGPSSPSSSPAGAEDGAEQDVLEQSLVDAAVAAVRAAFETPDPQAEFGAARLVKRLEDVLELPRDDWPPSALRALWEPLREAAAERKRSPRHEQRWLNLAGYCLRPGVGFPMDPVRIKALWPTFHQGVSHPKDVQCWVEWWVLWRRVAAGLNRAHHDEIYRRLAPFLLPGKGGVGPAAKKLNRPKPEPHELAEMWRCAAALERLEPSRKVALGDVLARVVGRPQAPRSASWCLGRLGARVPLYGPANTAVSREVAGRWAEVLLGVEPSSERETEDLVFALSQIGRVSSDRARDLDEELRLQVIRRLEALGADEETIRPVREFHELRSKAQGVALGDALPVGLRLVGDEG
ncbi:Hsp70 family protein [Tautonia sociabilis]|uniref:Molecular chaperone DnaK n=1 Tax=Tautonia sociabilis TaxID=2080755 RepID=A0A432MLG4_9BACT|nr:Hsp70 family protein [Tautonia sociabilis]RUL88047.1 molecular chaperone DnaK [Tautonia sociabilis]